MKKFMLSEGSKIRIKLQRKMFAFSSNLCTDVIVYFGLSTLKTFQEMTCLIREGK